MSQCSSLDVTRAIYTAAAVNMKPYTRLNNQWDYHKFICSMTNYYITIYVCVPHFLLPLRFGWLLVLGLYKEDYLQIFKRVSFWLYGCCG